MSIANEPAFPADVSCSRDTGELKPYQFDNNGFRTLGMTLRQYAAIEAMKGILASSEELTYKPVTVATRAIAAADRVIAELEKQK